MFSTDFFALYFCKLASVASSSFSTMDKSEFHSTSARVVCLALDGGNFVQTITAACDCRLQTTLQLTVAVVPAPSPHGASTTATLETKHGLVLLSTARRITKEPVSPCYPSVSEVWCESVRSAYHVVSFQNVSKV